MHNVLFFTDGASPTTVSPNFRCSNGESWTAHCDKKNPTNSSNSSMLTDPHLDLFHTGPKAASSVLLVFFGFQNHVRWDICIAVI